MFTSFPPEVRESVVAVAKAPPLDDDGSSPNLLSISPTFYEQLLYQYFFVKKLRALTVSMLNKSAWAKYGQNRHVEIFYPARLCFVSCKNAIFGPYSQQILNGIGQRKMSTPDILSAFAPIFF